MPRSSRLDPIEKFRFKLTVISVDLSLDGAINTVAGAVGGNSFAVLTRAGFNEITLPRANVNSYTYRENLDAQRSSKIPGLVTYEPITLRRGVTSTRDLYDWYRLVNDESFLLASAQELARDSIVAPPQSDNFRKDVIIECLDREGAATKAWQLMNCFPNTYKPGDDLIASSEEKLIEELGLEYEFFLELEGAGAEDFLKELARGVAVGVLDGALDTFGDNLPPFRRY